MDISEILRWIILGVLILIGIGIVGLVAEVAVALIAIGLKVLVIVLVGAVVVQLFERLRA